MDYSFLADSEIAKGAVEGGFLVGAFFSLTDDKGTVELVVACREMFGITSRNNNTTRRYVTLIINGFRLGNVNDFGASGNDGIGAENGFRSDACPLNNNTTRTNETMVFDDDGSGLQRLENTSDAYTTAEVYVLVAVGTRDEISEKTSAKKEEKMKALLEGINDDLVKKGPALSRKQLRLDRF